MKTTPGSLGVALRSAAAMLSLSAALVLIGGTARAQNYAAAPLVPDHIYELRGVSFGNGTYVALEPSAMFFFGPVKRPVGLVARGVLGAGASGAGIGFAVNTLPRCPAPHECWGENDDFFMGPFVGIEGRVERVDVTDRTNHHVQVGVGSGF